MFDYPQSGFLPVPTELPMMISPYNVGISSLYWLHGTLDPYFPIHQSQLGFQSLKHLNFFKSTQFSPIRNLAHFYDNAEEMGLVARWLEKLIHAPL